MRYKSFWVIFEKKLNLDSKPATDSQLSIFKRAIYDFDDTKSLKNEPIILEGGWSKWISFYPGFTQASKNFTPLTNGQNSKNVSISSIKNLLDLDYNQMNNSKPVIANSPSLNINETHTIKTHLTEQNKNIEPSQIQPIPTVNNEVNNLNLSTRPIISAIPSVNRTNKPTSNVNKTSTSKNIDLENSSQRIDQNKALEISSSSSDDEEDRKIFEKNSINLNIQANKSNFSLDEKFNEVIFNKSFLVI